MTHREHRAWYHPAPKSTWKLQLPVVLRVAAVNDGYCQCRHFYRDILGWRRGRRRLVRLPARADPQRFPAVMRVARGRSRKPKLATRSFRIQGGDDQKDDMALGRAPHRQKNQIWCCGPLEFKWESPKKTTRGRVAGRADKNQIKCGDPIEFKGESAKKTTRRLVARPPTKNQIECCDPIESKGESTKKATRSWALGRRMGQMPAR